MKKIVVFLFLLTSINLFAQSFLKSGLQTFQKPSDGKSLVYILKSGAGALINFRIYKDDVFLGVLSSGNYIVVECDPGKHLFWAASENRDFIETNLLPNRVYVLNAEGQMGAFIASVSLKQLDPNKKSNKNLFYRNVKNNSAVVFNPNKPSEEDKTENIKKGLAKYEDLNKNNSTKIIKLDNNLFFEDANKFIKN